MAQYCPVLLLVQWHVASQSGSKPLLGRSQLEKLGLRTKHILAAAADRFRAACDLASISRFNGGDRIKRVYSTLSNSKRGVEEHQVDESELWLGLGESSDVD